MTQADAVPAAPDSVAVDFWFDPACPWAWLTSRWMLEVQQVRAVTPRWRIMSLAVLNAEKLTEEWAAKLWPPVRVLAAAEAAHGAEVLGPLYTALGTLRHVAGRDLDSAALEEALTRCELDLSLAKAADSTELDAVITASHESAMALVGSDVGTPILRTDSFAIFGPVVSPAPRGEAAGRLWDAVTEMASMPEFFELKRTRTAPPQVV